MSTDAALEGVGSGPTRPTKLHFATPQGYWKPSSSLPYSSLYSIQWLKIYCMIIFFKNYVNAKYKGVKVSFFSIKDLPRRDSSQRRIRLPAKVTSALPARAPAWYSAFGTLRAGSHRQPGSAVLCGALRCGDEERRQQGRG